MRSYDDELDEAVATLKEAALPAAQPLRSPQKQRRRATGGKGDGADSSFETGGKEAVLARKAKKRYSQNSRLT